MKIQSQWTSQCTLRRSSSEKNHQLTIKMSSTHRHQPPKNSSAHPACPQQDAAQRKKFSTHRKKFTTPIQNPRNQTPDPRIWAHNSGRTGAPIRDAPGPRNPGVHTCVHSVHADSAPDASLINSSFGTHWTPHFGPKFGTPQDPQFGTGWDPQFGTHCQTPKPRFQTPDPRPWPPNHHSTPQNHTELTGTSHQTHQIITPDHQDTPGIPQDSTTRTRGQGKHPEVPISSIQETQNSMTSERSPTTE